MPRRERALGSVFRLSERNRVPGDADLLIVAGPTAPLRKTERDAIIDYLETGGSLLLAVDPQVSLFTPNQARVKTGLEEYLSKLGVEVRTDYILMDWEPARSRIQQVFLPTTQVTTRGPTALVSTLPLHGTTTESEHQDAGVRSERPGTPFPRER